MDESEPYPELLGIDWAFDNNAVLNLKKRQMSYETDTLRMVATLYPYEADWYNEPLDEEVKILIIENIYKIIGHKEDYINPTTNRYLIWRSVKYHDMDSTDAMERWKNKIYEVSMRRCSPMSIEERMEYFGSYMYDGSNPVDISIAWIQCIPKYWRICTLESVLTWIPARWCTAHYQPY
jgi:hypothetical protein